MSTILQSISTSLASVCWAKRNGKRRPGRLIVPKGWPASHALGRLVNKRDSQKRPIWLHVRAVIASVNQLLSIDGITPDFFVSSGNQNYDSQTMQLAWTARNMCWGVHKTPSLFGSQKTFAEAFLRVAALYHDIGKTMSDDHHVSRGVHLLRDVNSATRRDMDRLFENTKDRRCFWNILRHHDVFGCLCTGEASLPALADMVGWISTNGDINSSFYTPLAQMSLLLWLNVADVNAVLTFAPKSQGISTVEAGRYLLDWEAIRDYFTDAAREPRSNNREAFKAWAIQRAATAEMTIKRITRIVASCYKLRTNSICPEKESQIETLVEEELRALHGPRFERFCSRFARFCKIDYGLRFFRVLMARACENRHEDDGLSRMIGWTCAILHRIVEEYGHLVDADNRAAPRIGVDLSKLMQPEDTGMAISESMEKNQAGALWWIMDEIGIWLFGY